MKKALAAFAATLLLTGGLLGTAAAAYAEDEVIPTDAAVTEPSAPAEQAAPAVDPAPAPDPTVIPEDTTSAFVATQVAIETGEVFWLMPDGGTAEDVTWPQDYVADPTVCTPTQVTFQADTYPVTAIAGLIADGKLTKGEDYSVVISWRFVQSTVCPPEEEEPPVTNVTCETFADGGTATNLNANGWVDFDTRATGHAEYVESALHIWTEGATSTDKVSWAQDIADIPLSQVGQLGIDFQNDKLGDTDYNQFGPGVNLFVDITGDGIADGTLVYEPVYGQDLWVTNGSAQALKDASQHTGGNGSENHGTIDQYLTTFPTATVTAFAFAAGSGAHLDGLLKSVTVGCSTYTFDYTEPVIETPPPTVVVPLPPTFDDLCGTENDVTNVPDDTESATYTVSTEGNVTTVTATANEGFALGSSVDVNEGIVYVYTITWEHEFTDVACPVVTPPVTTPTVPTDKLALTGTGPTELIAAFAALVMGLGVALMRRRRLA